MKKGVWHQFGDRSQKLVLEQLEHENGVGVILSPRDIASHTIVPYCKKYLDLGADIILDPQFYIPTFKNDKIQSYSFDTFRNSIASLHRLSQHESDRLSKALETDNKNTGSTAILAPAVMYEAGRPDLADLNARLFSAARRTGESLGLPTIGTIVLGNSVTSSDDTLNQVLSQASSLEADQWYFGFEFSDERIPSDLDSVYRCCSAGLTLACTNKPVLHAYAGPLSILSFGFGATGAAIGHSQNLWRFTRDRWGQTASSGGGGDAPPRFFSKSLWGTIVYPDETSLLSSEIRNEILTLSPFSVQLAGGLRWTRWDANKHLVYAIGTEASAIAKLDSAEACLNRASKILKKSLDLHHKIESALIELRDDTNTYQSNWQKVIDILLNNRGEDFEYLGLL